MRRCFLLAILLVSCSRSASSPPPPAMQAAAQDVKVSVLGFESSAFEMPQGEPE
ncbi:MAG: hypothetical protein HY293_02910, partial [Planctomycetes bacterium]|nr:hypothetical protein [Planctomycetota bacterium]